MAQSGSTAVRNALVYAAVAALALLLWQVRALLLLAFGGVLIGLILTMPTDWLNRHMRLPRRLAFALAVTAVVAALALVGVFVWYRVAAQFAQLSMALPDGAGVILEQLPQWARSELQTLREAQSQESSGVLGRAIGTAGLVFGAIGDLVLVLFLGLFFAADPRRYRDGLVRLAPQAKQERLREVLNSCGSALRRWLLGQFVSMLAVGILTTAGLLLLGIPMAFALGLIAGLLEFVPVIGPLAAAVPAVLVAVTLGPTQALWVTLLYLGIQQVESNLLQPLVQRWAVEMPPVIGLVAGVGFALVFGLVGVLFAVPLALVTMILVGKLYIEDALGQKYRGPGAG